MRKYFNLVLVSIIGVISGIFLCIAVKKWTALHIDPTVSFEINPFELFSLIITTILAIYVARTITKTNDLEKSEKDLIIDYLTNFNREFREKISSLLEQQEFDTAIASSNFKIIRKRIDSVISLGVEHNFIISNDPYSVDLTNKVRDIWELFTDTPKKANGKSTAAVKEDIARLRLEQVNKIEMAVIEIEKLLFQLIMKVNRK